MRAINEANTSIHIMVFKLNSEGIIYALDNAIKRGVEVRIIVDRKLLRDQEDASTLLRSLVQFKIYKGLDKEIMHNKVTLIDSVRVIMGTGNYIEEDFKDNHENIIFIESTDLYKQLAKYFEKVWQADNCRSYEYNSSKRLEIDLRSIYKGFLSFRVKLVLLLISLAVNVILLTQ